MTTLRNGASNSLRSSQSRKFLPQALKAVPVMKCDLSWETVEKTLAGWLAISNLMKFGAVCQEASGGSYCGRTTVGNPFSMRASLESGSHGFDSACGRKCALRSGMTKRWR